jgi:CHASE2 domain-containing sensor protein
LAQAKRPIGHFYFDENHEILVVSDHVVRFIAKPSPEQPTQKSFAEVLAATDGQSETPPSKYISWLLPPENGAETFLTLSAEQILGRTNPPIELPLTDLFKNRIVLIGGSFSDRDYHLTPLSVVTKQRFHGVFIHAQILAQLLDHRSIHPLSWPIDLVLFAFAACAGIWLGRRDRARHYHVWVESAGAVGLVAVNALMFVILGMIFPIMLTLLFLLVGAAIGYHSRRLLT